MTGRPSKMLRSTKNVENFKRRIYTSKYITSFDWSILETCFPIHGFDQIRGGFPNRTLLIPQIITRIPLVGTSTAHTSKLVLYIPRQLFREINKCGRSPQRPQSRAQLEFGSWLRYVFCFFTCQHACYTYTRNNATLTGEGQFMTRGPCHFSGAGVFWLPLVLIRTCAHPMTMYIP